METEGELPPGGIKVWAGDEKEEENTRRKTGIAVFSRYVVTLENWHKQEFLNG
jgi:hypothetical protein